MTGKDPEPHTIESLVILIVDDEVSIAETLAEFVQELGYTPFVAYNGQEALDLARKSWPALVITDLMMPILNGVGLIKALHAEAAAHSKRVPPIVMLSAVNTTAAMREVKVDMMLPKPFDLDRLEQAIQYLLNK